METTQALSPRESYLSLGYYVYRNLIPSKLIDAVLEAYKTEVLFTEDHFIRQSSGRWERNRISPYGYSVESFLNVHDYRKQALFAKATREIFCSDSVKNALSELTGDSSHALIQTMLFDQNTGTKAHQDWFYLDTIPNGHLLAGWFALEDIHEDAGRFFVIPGSHRSDFDLSEDEKISNPLYLRRLEHYMIENKTKMHVPALKKGDVLFWNSGTIHGSTETRDPKYSRKSLTAHYVPTQYEVGRRYDKTTLKIEYASHNDMKYRLYPKLASYNLSARMRADVFHYLWKRPRLMKVAKMVKGISKRRTSKADTQLDR